MHGYHYKQAEQQTDTVGHHGHHRNSTHIWLHTIIQNAECAYFVTLNRQDAKLLSESDYRKGRLTCML